MAEGGYNAVFKTVDKDDSIEAHIHDTLKGGSFLNDEKLVEILVNESPKRLIDLENYGALFDRQESVKSTKDHSADKVLEEPVTRETEQVQNC